MITIGKLNELSGRMRAAPKIENENRKISREEALQKLLPAIKAMSANGYDPEQIADTVSAGGLKVSPRQIARMASAKPAPRRQPERGA